MLTLEDFFLGGGGGGEERKFSSSSFLFWKEERKEGKKLIRNRGVVWCGFVGLPYYLLLEVGGFFHRFFFPRRLLPLEVPFPFPRYRSSFFFLFNSLGPPPPAEYKRITLQGEGGKKG